MRRKGGVAVFGVIETEAGNAGVRRPVLLLLAEGAGKERQDERGRVLGVEEWVGAARKAQFAAKLVDGLGPVAGSDAGQPLHDAAHARGTVGASEAGVRRQDGWIERGEEREWGEEIAGPGDAGDFGNEGTGVVEFAKQEQVGAGGGGGGGEQIVVSLAENGEEEVAQACLGAFVDVVDHGHKAGVLGVDIGVDGIELDAERLDFGPVKLREGHHGSVAAASEFDGNGDEGVGIAVGANVR